MTDTEALHIDISVITQLVLSERESRDLGRWKRMEDCFHPDARIRLSWIDGSAEEFVRGSKDMAARGMKATHRVSPPVVRVCGDRALASLSAIIDIPAVVGGVEAHLSSYARFLFRTERRDGRWRIAFFDAIYARDELVPAIPGQIIHITDAALTSYRRSYRMLCYLLGLTGYVPSQDLAGDDLPDTANAMLKEVFDWLGMEADTLE